MTLYYGNSRSSLSTTLALAAFGSLGSAFSSAGRDLDGYTFLHPSQKDPVNTKTQIVHGPQKVGKRGKPKRW